MRKLTLIARWDADDAAYYAVARRGRDEDEAFRCLAASPDEARGALLRELWLGGSLDLPVLIDLETDGGSEVEHVQE